MEEQKQLTKKERQLLRQEEKDRQKTAHSRSLKFKKIKSLAIWTIVAVVVVGGIGFYLARPLPGEIVSNLGNEHITSVSSPHLPYNSVPPTSGPHIGSTAPWGIHNNPIDNEVQVHNLEDGGVMVQYWCGEGDTYQSGCPELVEQLSEIVGAYHSEVILAPYPGLDSKIALTAWNRIDKFDEFDKERILKFINSYRGIDHHAR